MQLEEIRFERLRQLPIKLKWGSDNFHQERFFYSDDRYIYKIWHRKYVAHQLEVMRGRYTGYTFRKQGPQIAAIDCGLVGPETCPAFVDVILDGDGTCRGYVLRKGAPVLRNSEISSAFVDLIWRVTLETGYAHTDLCAANIVKLGSDFSLIDIDSNPTNIAFFDVEFERAKGSLRAHVLPEYRNRLELHVRAEIRK